MLEKNYLVVITTSIRTGGVYAWEGRDLQSHIILIDN